MIVAGEASGDLHGAGVVRAMRRLDPTLHFLGMGGEELREAGVDIVFDAKKLAVMGVLEVAAKIRDIVSAQRILRKRLQEEKIDLLILIDFPDFNLKLAACAKALGIPVFYYICPKVWASRSSRIKTIRKRVDRLALILPFEKEFLGQRGVEAEYVGNPLLDCVFRKRSREQFLTTHGIDSKARCIGLLPGSRMSEVNSLLPLFLQAACKLGQARTEELVFLVPKAATISRQALGEAGVDRYSNLVNIKIIEDDRYEMMAACDCVVAASGTVTLELALLTTPMVVAYRLAPVTYALAKCLVKIPFFSLVNLIAGYRVVPELLQHEVTQERIVHELNLLLNSYQQRTDMIRGLQSVKEKLGKPGASARAAQLALGLLDKTG